MKLGIIKTIQREELSKYGELPSWMNSFLQTLNQFIGQVGLALKGNLTFADNFRCTVKTIEFTHGVELKLNPESKARVIGAFPISANGSIIDRFGWSPKQDGSIGVSVYFSSGTSAICTIIILLG